MITLQTSVLGMEMQSSLFIMFYQILMNRPTLDLQKEKNPEHFIYYYNPYSPVAVS